MWTTSPAGARAQHQRPVFPWHGGDSSAAGVPISHHLEAHLRSPGGLGLYDVC